MVESSYQGIIQNQVDQKRAQGREKSTKRFLFPEKSLLLTTIAVCVILFSASQAQAWGLTVHNNSEHRVSVTLWCVNAFTTWITNNIQSAAIDPGKTAVLKCKGATCMMEYEVKHEMSGCPAFHSEYTRYDPDWRIEEWTCTMVLFFGCCFNKTITID